MAEPGRPIRVSIVEDDETLREGLGFLIEVDGGIDAKTAALCREAGADVMVAGTSVFKAADRAAEIRALRGDR